MHCWTKGKFNMSYSITQLIWLLTAESVPITITCMRTYMQSYISFMRAVNREGLCQFFFLVTAIKIGAQWEASDDKLSRFHSRWHDKVNRLHILLQMHSIWADAYLKKTADNYLLWVIKWGNVGDFCIYRKNALVAFKWIQLVFF